MTYALSPALRAELTRKSDWRGAWETAKDWLLILAGFTLSVLWPHPLAWLASILLLAAGQAGLAILQHEASHRSLFASARLNDIVGDWFAAQPLLQSMPGYRAYHMTHHRLAGTPDDPDLIMTEQYPVNAASLRRKLLRDVSGLTGLKSVIGLIGMQIGYWQYELTGRVVRVQPHPQGMRGFAHAFMARRGWIAWLWQGIFLGVLTLLGHAEVYLLWLIAFLFVLPVCMRVRQIADHAVVADPHSSDALQHARSSQASWWERWLLAPHNEHYHLEHHLLPTAPCWNLPRLHEVLAKDGVIPAQNQGGSLVSVLRQATR